MHLILLHGATGVWDEVVCLVVPATAIMGVALAVLRGNPEQEAEIEDAADAAEDAANDADDKTLTPAQREGR